jgi:exodeoxyribonuclease VII small subunit
MPKQSTTATAAPQAISDLEGLSYEQARDELVSVVARLEAGGATLEESLVLWERGEALAARCQQWLDGARQRLTAARDSDATTPAAGAGPDAGPEPDPAELDPADLADVEDDR